MGSRVDSALSKVLLDTGSVDARALEEAAQQQGLHGGALDTLLLELGAVDERRLAELIAEANRTPAVSLERLLRPDADAVHKLPERMARAMRLCPLFVDERGVHVAAASPVDHGLIDEVAALVGQGIVVHAVPELRLHQALAAAYGGELDERFAALVADVTAPTPDPTAAVGDDVSAAASWDLVEALAHLAAADTRDAIARVACAYARKFLPFAAVVGLRGSQVVGWHRSGPAEGVQFANRPFAIPEDSVLFHALQNAGPSVGKPALAPGNAAFFGWLGRRRPRSVLVVPVTIGDRVVAALIGDGGIRARDYAQLADLVAFSARLAPAFERVIRHHKTTLPPREAAPALAPPPPPPPLPPPAPSFYEETTARMPVIARTLDETTGEGEAAVAAPAEVTVPVPAPPPPSMAPRPITMTAMPAVQLPPSPAERAADGTSPFARNYVAQRTSPPEPVAEPIAPMVLDSLNSPAIEAMLPAAARAAAAAAVAASFSELTDNRAADAWRGALQETVARGHQGGSGARDQQTRLFHDEEGWEEIRYDAPATPAASRAPPIAAPGTQHLVAETLERLSPGPEEEQVEVIEAEPPSPVELLVDTLEALDQPTVEYAQRQLVRLGQDAIPALAQRFPGRLRVDPFDPGEYVRRGDELGPLIGVLEQLGAAGLEAATPHLDSRYPAHRFAAVLLFAQNPDVRGIDLLRARLHDTEPRIRALATEALVPFIAHPRFDAVLTHLRERLHSSLLDARRRAVQLLGAFRDVGAVPLLIAALESRDKAELAEDLRLALRAITLKDFGVRARGWERWWAKARKKSRVDWLLEGLDHDDRELRTIASLELTALVGDDFGYRPDADKRARQRASAAFSRWWLDEQRRYGGGPVTSSPTASTGSRNSPD
ncbi:MAG: hypothetical protein HYS27_18765 [Deltaproteobacteria bacterium]|nr:hypothetical protein [Deltaproteobacteria bacterium]